ncbi:Transcription factor vrtR1 [Pseudocercospora fuligena]|uniref:Transcription factor vrtR1 n=1 Tax=Pseudocercospora fuligena TaxID=685502 RepID=A0A8H6VGV6_9PEZI|nr:Transcription factor vrtR1 [Pseudocercospora fuligena]
MASVHNHQQGHYHPITPAPSKASPAALGNGDDKSNANLMAYACQTCTRRKVKCDKIAPACTSCRDRKLECTYQAPPPRRRKRKLSGGGGGVDDVHDKLASYERILQRHGLLPQDNYVSPESDSNSHSAVAANPRADESTSISYNNPETSRTGKIVAGQGKSRYIDSNIWRSLGEDEMQRMSDVEDDDDDQTLRATTEDFASDPLTRAFLGYQYSLTQCHPTHTEALVLWRMHRERVEPLCKILHIPSTTEMVHRVSQDPASASKSEETVLFAIYHFAVVAASDEECMASFRESRAALRQRYNFAARQALVNAGFLKTTEMNIMQAFTLFLMSCRTTYDPHTLWILTGVAIRISQRMGLHRDGESLGLPPFDVQMRRRLFYQVMPLDGAASHMSGTGIAIMPHTWDVKPPLNINDDQIWPGMTEKPEPQQGATDMIFCLTRATVGHAFVRMGESFYGSSLKSPQDIEPIIKEAESKVEENYIRYCDIVNPLHFLTISLARSAITAMRLRTRLPKVRNQTVTDAERRELFRFALKIMDTDAAACAQGSLKIYSWHVHTFFVWGSWDSVIFLVTTLRKADLLSPEETDAAWSRLEMAAKNHPEVLESKQALHTAIRRILLKAWEINPPNNKISEPSFITTLRSLRKARAEKEKQDFAKNEAEGISFGAVDPSPVNDADIFTNLSGDINMALGNDFNLDNADWNFWENLIQDYNQTQGV